MHLAVADVARHHLGTVVAPVAVTTATNRSKVGAHVHRAARSALFPPLFARRQGHLHHVPAAVALQRPAVVIVAAATATGTTTTAVATISAAAATATAATTATATAATAAART